MNILLLNENPVVNKLVTLSAQKTSDTLDVVDSVENITKESYDLLVIDDTLYSDDIFALIQEKTTYKSSLFICARDTQTTEGFNDVLKKPFLPTDLVELFSSIAKDVQQMEAMPAEEPIEELEPIETLDDIDTLEDDFEEEIDLSAPPTQSVLDDDEAQKVKDLLDETSDEFDDLDDELDLNNIELDDELDLELEDGLELETEATPTDAKEEEALVEEDFDLELEDSLEDAFDLEEDDTLQEVLENDVELESEATQTASIEEEELVEEEKENLEIDDTIEEDFDLESENVPEESLETDSFEDAFDLEEESLEDVVENDLEAETLVDAMSEDMNIEDQIEAAVGELSPEDLEEEVSEETLLEIAENEINSFDQLSSKDLKLAIGEEIEEDDVEEEEIEPEPAIEEEPEIEEEVLEETHDGVEALKNLLAALSDKNVAASLKGMKININITLGENS